MDHLKIKEDGEGTRRLSIIYTGWLIAIIILGMVFVSYGLKIKVLIILLVISFFSIIFEDKIDLLKNKIMYFVKGEAK